MHEGMVCLESANLGCQILEGPESHGSRRIEKVPGVLWASADNGHGLTGEKVRRKVESPFRCLIVRDIVKSRLSSDQMQ